MGLIWRPGFDFAFDSDACMACRSRCCRGTSGRIWVTLQEIDRISGFLKMNFIDFSRKYLEQRENRWSIRERYTGHDFACVFLNIRKNRCAIYGVRPLQCRLFPFWPYFKEHKDELIEECPGISALSCKILS